MAYEMFLGVLALVLIFYVWKYKVSTMTMVFLVVGMIALVYYFTGDDTPDEAKAAALRAAQLANR